MFIADASNGAIDKVINLSECSQSSKMVSVMTTSSILGWFNLLTAWSEKRPWVAQI